MGLTWFAWLLPMWFIRKWVLLPIRRENLPCLVTMPGETSPKEYHIFTLGKGMYVIESAESVLQDKIRSLKDELSTAEYELDKMNNPGDYKR